MPNSDANALIVAQAGSATLEEARGFDDGVDAAIEQRTIEHHRRNG